MTITTPYYRTLAEVGELMSESAETSRVSSVDTPDINYTPYTLFSLKTRLQAGIDAILGNGIDIRMISQELRNRMILTLIFYRGNTEVIPEPEIERKIQDLVDVETTERTSYSLIFTSARGLVLPSGRVVSPQWVSSMLPFVNTARQHPHGVDIYCASTLRTMRGGDKFLHKVQFHPQGIFGDLSSIIDYKKFSIQMGSQIREELIQMYQSGYVLNPDDKIAAAWELKSVNVEVGLFRPMWKDERFAHPLADFLQQRIRGHDTIILHVSENWATRHFVASALLTLRKQFFFSGDHVHVNCYSLRAARKIVAAIDDAVATAVGLILHFRVAHEKDLSTYVSDISKSNLVPKVIDSHTRSFITYRIEEFSHPWVLSYIVPFTTNVQTLSQRIRETVLKYRSGE